MSTLQQPNATSWKTVPLGEIAEIKLGKMLDRSKHTTGRKLPYLRNVNVRWGAIETNDLREMYFDDDQVERFGIKDNDVLVCEGGEPGRAALWRSGPTNLKFQKALHRVRFRVPYEPQLLIYLLERLAKSGGLERRFTGSTIKHFTREAFLRLPVPLPPVPEQQRLVAEIEKQFSRLEVAIGALKLVHGNLRRYRAAVLDAAVLGRIVRAESDTTYATGPSHVTTAYPPKQPVGWTWCRLEELASADNNSITDGPFGSNLKTEHYTVNGPRVIRLQNIGDGVFVDERAHISEQHFLQLQRHRVFAGDLVIAAFGADPPRACIIPETVGPAIVKADCIRFKPASSVEARYLNAALNSPMVRRRTTALVHGIGRPRLNLREIKSILIPLPPLAEQKRIAAEVERRLSVIEEVEKLVDASLQRAARLRQSILERAFSGRLVKSKVTEKSEPKTKAMSPASRRHFLRAVLSAEIVHQLHAEPTFGQTKHQKIFHLCEHIAELTDLDVQYHRDAAGPYDNRLIYANEAELKRQKWYESYSRKKIGHGYHPLAKAGGHEKYLERYWPEKLETIRRLIRLMRHWDTEGCEIFSTAYAAWNDLLLWGHEASDDAIVHEVLHRWHKSKQRIPEERWRKALEWMRKEGFVPTGFGKPTAAASS
jgi:type I restriction enzyme S subunit